MGVYDELPTSRPFDCFDVTFNYSVILTQFRCARKVMSQNLIFSQTRICTINKDYSIRIGSAIK